MSKESEFVQKAKEIVANACRESIEKVKVGDSIIIDERFKYDHGDFHKWRAGDEFEVKHIKKTECMTVLYCVATKATPDGGHSVRGEVGDQVEFDDKMSLFNYLRCKGDLTAVHNLRQLCRDYLNGMM
jgi:hypothetical protein